MAKRTSPRWKSDPVVQRTIMALRTDALGLPEGAPMGQEPELMERYGVSRLSLRLAATVVAQEQLLRVRRGAKGGYFSARPTARAATRTAAVYLKANGASLKEIISAAESIRVGVARHAALSPDPALPGMIEKFFAENHVESAETSDFIAMLKADRLFWRTLAQGCGNRVLGLFMEVVLSLGATVEESEDPLLGRPERLQAMIDRRVQVARAVLEHDPEVATLVARRNADDDVAATFRSWTLDSAAAE